VWQDASPMSRQIGRVKPLAEDRTCASRAVDAARDYRRVRSVLVSRARWLGSRHPEDAAQEAFKRSLENSSSQSAIEYYFSDEPIALHPPEWSLEQLLAWLHGVLYYVVREEYNKASTHREVSGGGVGPENTQENIYLDPADPAPSQLDSVIQRELQKIVVDCFPMLEHEYRTVLEMRVDGLTYGEIAGHLGVNENTVATWVTRGIRTLAQRVRNHIECFTARRRP